MECSRYRGAMATLRKRKRRGRRRKGEHKYVRAKGFNLYNVSLYDWTDDEVMSFFGGSETLIRIVARSLSLEIKESRKWINDIFLFAWDDDLASDIRVIHRAYLENAWSKNWHKQFYRQLIPLLKMYNSELKEARNPAVYLPCTPSHFESIDWVFTECEIPFFFKDILFNFYQGYNNRDLATKYSLTSGAITLIVQDMIKKLLPSYPELS